VNCVLKKSEKLGMHEIGEEIGEEIGDRGFRHRTIRTEIFCRFDILSALAKGET